MIGLGFPRARALRGGVAAWRAAGFELAERPSSVPVTVAAAALRG